MTAAAAGDCPHLADKDGERLSAEVTPDRLVMPSSTWVRLLTGELARVGVASDDAEAVARATLAAVCRAGGWRGRDDHAYVSQRSRP